MFCFFLTNQTNGADRMYSSQVIVITAADIFISGFHTNNPRLFQTLSTPVVSRYFGIRMDVFKQSVLEAL